MCVHHMYSFCVCCLWHFLLIISITLNPLSATFFYSSAPISLPPVLCATVEVFDTQASLSHECTAQTS
jgi:hypothetical protein